MESVYGESQAGHTELIKLSAKMLCFTLKISSEMTLQNKIM